MSATEPEPAYLVVKVTTKADGEILSEEDGFYADLHTLNLHSPRLVDDVDTLATTDDVTTTFRFKLNGVYVDDPRTPMTYDEWVAFCQQARQDEDALARDEDAAFQAMIDASVQPVSPAEPELLKLRFTERIILWVLTGLYHLGFKQFTCKKANKWGGKFSQGRPRREAVAAAFQGVQTTYPRCKHCTWAELPGDLHEPCEADLRDLAAHDDDGWTVGDLHCFSEFFGQDAPSRSWEPVIRAAGLASDPNGPHETT